MDYFHDSEKAVSLAFEKDKKILKGHGFEVQIDIAQPGYIRIVLKDQKESTKIEWAHDSQWRFFPVVSHPDSGFQLSDVDLAINKVLALAGRNEARDFLDTIYIHENIISLGGACWAAAGKDPGFTPHSLLEMLKRKGRFQDADFERLDLVYRVDPQVLKNKWLNMLKEAHKFIESRPLNEQGCLYLSKSDSKVFSPAEQDKIDEDYNIHYGKPGGVIPVFSDKRIHSS